MSERLRAHPGTRPATREDIAGLEILEGLDDEFLDWFAEQARVVELEADEVFMEPDDEAAEMLILLDGATELEFRPDGGEPVFLEYVPGEVGGTLPYSRMKVYQGRALATERSRLLWFPREQFIELVRRSADLGQRLVALMADRVRDATRFGEQRERLASLGKLSAGLAHELNNPASAVRRSAQALGERLARLPELVARLAENDVSYEQVCRADKLRAAAVAAGVVSLSAIQRSEREEAMTDWLEDHGVPDAYMRAETLVDAGLTPADLERNIEGLPSEAVADLLAWVEGGLAAERLLGEIDAAAGRISDLVAAVKSYTYADRAQECQPTDIRPGIRSTLTILDHKLRRKSIRVEQDMPDDLPAVSGYPGELNQVWTNLIDNAVDAMDEGGTLRIEAERVGSHVEIRFTDDGSGIPEDMQARIFEPFFTTKDVGQGTGLGLDIVRRIITARHGGSIDVESEPGRTTFTLRLDLA